MQVVVSDGVEIYYEVRGEGPTVLLHTGAGGDSRIWEHAGYVDALPGYRKILMDQRGRGRSGRPASLESHRMERFVSDIAAVLDDAGADKAAFWAYSNGIYVGLAFGAAHPGRLRAMIGTGTLSYSDICDLPPIEDPKAFIEEQVARGGVVAEVDRFMYALSRIARRSWRGPRSLYATCSVPVLILVGAREGDDGETEKSVAEIPNARMVRIPGVGHLESFSRSDLTVPPRCGLSGGTSPSPRRVTDLGIGKPEAPVASFAPVGI